MDLKAEVLMIAGLIMHIALTVLNMLLCNYYKKIEKDIH